jgi:hypothetical protein
MQHFDGKKLLLNSKFSFILGFEKVLAEDFSICLQKAMKLGLRAELFINGGKKQVKEIMRCLNIKKSWDEVINLDKRNVEQQNGEFLSSALNKLVKMPTVLKSDYDTELMLYSMHNSVIVCNVKDYAYFAKNKELLGFCKLAFEKAGIVLNYHEKDENRKMGGDSHKILMNQEGFLNSRTRNQIEDMHKNSCFWKITKSNLKCLYLTKFNYLNFNKIAKPQDIVIEINKNAFLNKDAQDHEPRR